MIDNKYLSSLLLIILLLVGFWFRYQGISLQLSYWNDESHTALKARNIVWDGSPNSVGQGTGIYQLGFYYLTAGAFKLLGINELAGRLPSVIAGTSLIFIIWLVAKHLFKCERKAFLAAVLLGLSQIQLAWSTQLRPYIWVELFTVLITYFCYLYLQQSKILHRNLFIAVGLATIASLFHGTGLINWLLIILITTYQGIALKRHVYIWLALLFIIAALLLFQLSQAWELTKVLTRFNFDITHYRIFLTHSYWWLISGAVLGGLLLLRKDTKLALLLSSFITTIFALAILKIDSQYVRYSLPTFPLLYLLFSSGVVDTADWATSKLKITSQKLKIIVSLSIIGLALVWPIKANKILLWPKYYYSINADMREDPIVDYKTAFAKIKLLLQGKEQSVVMDAWNDRVPWYLPGQPFIWLANTGYEVDPVFGEPVVGTIDGFEAAKHQYPTGIVIVEDWPSFTPPEVQHHIRQTLKHEFTVQDLPYNENDHWGISVYSWGL